MESTLHFHGEHKKYLLGSVKICIFVLHFFTLLKNPLRKVKCLGKMVKMFGLDLVVV